MTYTLIDSVTLTSSASSVTFSNIDQTYGDLVLSCSDIRSSTGGTFQFQLNGDTGNNYSWMYMSGNGSSTSSAKAGPQARIVISGGGMDNTGPIMATAQIMDYSATDKHTSCLIRSGNLTNVNVSAYAGRWANTSAVTSITLFGGSFNSGSTFYLYGIEA